MITLWMTETMVVRGRVMVLLVTPTREHADEYLAELLHALLA